jgi:hypothetical protein
LSEQGEAETPPLAFGALLLVLCFWCFAFGALLLVLCFWCFAFGALLFMVVIPRSCSARMRLGARSGMDPGLRRDDEQATNQTKLRTE